MTADDTATLPGNFMPTNCSRKPVPYEWQCDGAATFLPIAAP